MSKRKKTVLILSAFILLAVASIRLYLASTQPVYAGELPLQQLSAPVTVYHDSYGVPHIYGKTETDVYRALGYLVAQERLFQMEMIRRVSSGRLAELFGSSLLDVDRFFRTLGIPQHADSSASHFQSAPAAPWKAASLAYLDGVNQYISSGRTPLEFQLLGIPKEPYTVKDLYLIVDYLAFNFEMGFRTDPLLSKLDNKLGKGYIDQLVLGYTPDQLRNFNHIDSSLQRGTDKPSFAAITEKLPIKYWVGSNAFAIAPTRSSSGKPLFENDTHIGQQQPGVWFEAHLNYPGQNFYGSFLAGFPFAPLGHSLHHSWGVTLFENDDVDFFAETTHDQDSNQVLIRGAWEQLTLRDETIRVKDSSEVTILCRSSSHGPICSDAINDFKEYEKRPVSVAWTLLQFPSNLLEAAYPLSTSQSLPSFRDAVSTMIAPCLNIIYADTSGNIAWYGAGKLVHRRPGVPTSLVLNGADSTQEWLGVYDFSANPRSENPPCGYVYSCNHQPDTFQGIFHAGYYLTDERAQRLNTLLQEKNSYELNDVQQLATDVQNPYTKQVAQRLCQVVDTNAISPQDLSLIRLLRGWEGTHTLQDSATGAYYLFLYNVLHDALADDMGQKDFESFLRTHTVKYSVLPLLNNDTTKWWDDRSTSEEEKRSDIVTAALQKTTRKLIHEYGTDTHLWNWGKMHQLYYQHPVGKVKPLNMLFNVGPVASPGGLETVNNESFILSDKMPYTVLFGPALRRCVDLADPEHGVSVLPSGQSGNPMSPHYNDQASLYAKGAFRMEMMNEKEILQTCRQRLIFQPVNE